MEITLKDFGWEQKSWDSYDNTIRYVKGNNEVVLNFTKDKVEKMEVKNITLAELYLITELIEKNGR